MKTKEEKIRAEKDDNTGIKKTKKKNNGEKKMEKNEVKGEGKGGDNWRTGKRVKQRGKGNN